MLSANNWAIIAATAYAGNTPFKQTHLMMVGEVGSAWGLRVGETVACFFCQLGSGWQLRKPRHFQNLEISVQAVGFETSIEGKTEIIRPLGFGRRVAITIPLTNTPEE